MVKLADITTTPQKIHIPVFRTRKKFNKWYVEVYLKSAHWIGFAIWMKRQYPYCSECRRSHVVLETHHETYVNLGKETENDCRNLCGNCHMTIHKTLQDLGFATEREYTAWIKKKKRKRKKHYIR